MRLPPNEVELSLGSSEPALAAFRQWAETAQAPNIACDVETEGLQPYGPHRDRVRLVQFGDENEGWALPFVGNERTVQEALDRFAGRLVGHNSRFDEAMLTAEGIKTGPQWEDTYIAHHLLYPLNWHGLKPAAGQLYGPSVRAGEKWLDRVKADNGWDWATVPLDHPAYWGYGAFDAVLTARLATDLLGEAKTKFGPQYARELTVARMMANVSKVGLAVDEPYAQQLLDKWDAEEVELRARLEKVAITKAHSNAQIVASLLENEGWEPDVLTDTGKPSVNKDVLGGLDNDIARDVLRWRRIGKWRTSYVQPMLAAGGRVHANISSLRAKSGRMAVDTPPLQQLPKGGEVRSILVADEGEEIYAVDYDGQEAREIAAYAGDPDLTEQVLKGDIHGRIAGELFGIRYTKEQRGWTKNAIYAWSYGAGDSKLAVTAHAPAKEFKAAVKAAFPALADLMDGVLVKAKHRQEVDGMAWAKTLGGRIVAVPKSKHYALTNYIMQGSGADMLKIALVKMNDVGLAPYLRLVIHDENLLGGPAGPEMAEAAAETARLMQTTFMGVPFDTHISEAGQSWGEVA